MSNKLLVKLRGQSGASLMFVLGIMLMLLIIGTSALVAASAVAGGNVSQKQYAQLEQYSGSVQKNVMYSLQQGQMGEKLLWLLYDEHRAKPGTSITKDVTMSLKDAPGDFPDGLEKATLQLTLSPDIYCIEQTEWSPKESDEPDAEAEYEEAVVSKTYYISAVLSVQNTASLGARQILSVTEYDFTGGVIELPTGGRAEQIAAGEWRLLSHENLDIKPTRPED